MELGNIAMKYWTYGGPQFRRNCPKKGQYVKQKENKIKKKKKSSSPIKTTLHSLKPPLLNSPALSVKVMNKLSFRVIEQVAVVQSS